MRVGVNKTLRVIGEKSVLWLKIVVLALAGLMPALTVEPAGAAQLTSRQVTISTSEIGATNVQHAFSYTIPNTAAAKEGIIYEFCTTPLGACTLPTGMNLSGAAHVGQTGWPNNGTTAFARYTTPDVGDCVLTAITYRLCFNRTEATTGGGAVTHTINGITAPSAADTVYIRVYIYSDNDFGSGDLLDEGVVAAAFVNQLTVTGRVAERLEFCVGAIANGVGTPTNCAGLPTSTEVALGVIDDQDIYVSPIDDSATNNLANNSYGMAMVSTNASGGVAVTYYPEAQTNVTASDTDQLRAFRVAPTDCSATTTSVTDQCFVSANISGEDFTQGDEMFGMYIPCIDQRHDSIVTQNLAADADYVGVTGGTGTAADAQEANEADAATCQADEAPTVVNFAFNDTGTPDEIATSAGSADGVVDSEAIKLAFGATASPTTPEGSYLVVLTYIATPTF